MSQDTKSPENLYLVGTLLLFILLPFQNCTYSPVSVQFTSALANDDLGYRFETSATSKTFVSQAVPQKSHLTTFK